MNFGFKRSRAAAFFDLDGVVYAGSLGIDFMKHLFNRGMISETFISKLTDASVSYKAGVIGLTKYFNICADLWRKSIAGCKKETIEKEAELFVGNINGKIHKNAEKLIESDRAEGFMIIGVTGSPIEIAKQFSKLFKFDHTAGTRVSTMNGYYTGRLIKPCPVGKGKATIVQQIASKHNLNLKTSKAYGDSELDIEMLKNVGQPIAVNPDKKLEKQATKHGWKIIRW